VAVDVYPPSIAVLDPEVLVWVESHHAFGPPKKANSVISIINIPVK